jgi:hypothetical protein
MVGLRRGQGCVEDAVSAQRYGLRRRRSRQKGKTIGEGSERGEGVENRTHEMTEEIEEQQAIYTRAKQRGAAFPNRAGLSLKRQRTGSDSIHHSAVK